MNLALTLSLYIARQFTWATLSVIAFLTGLITMFDFIDLLRRVSTRPNVPTSLVSQIAFLHIPFACLEILPLACCWEESCVSGGWRGHRNWWWRGRPGFRHGSFWQGRSSVLY